MLGEGTKTSQTKSDKFEVEIQNNLEKFLSSQDEPYRSLKVSRYEGSDTKFYSDIKVTNPDNEKSIWIEVKLNKYANLGGPSFKYNDGQWTCTTTKEEGDDEDHLANFYLEALEKGSQKFIEFCRKYLKKEDIKLPTDLSPQLIKAWKASGSVEDTENDVQFITDKIPLEGFGEKIAEYYKTAKYEPVYYIQVDDELYIVDPQYNPLGLKTRDGGSLKTLSEAYRIGRIQFRAKGIDKKLKDGEKYYYSIVCDVKILADDEKEDELEYNCSFKSEDKFPVVSNGTENQEDEVGQDEMDEVRESLERMDSPEYLNEEKKKLFDRCAKVILEDWIPDYDDKPVNQWGEKWFKVPNDDAMSVIVGEIVKDCCSDPDLEHMPDTICLSSLHRVQGGHYIATIFGGCNGGGDPRKTIVYLSVIRKLAKKLFEKFGDVWLVDWSNDCLDDVWTVRIAFSYEKYDEYAEIEEIYDRMFGDDDADSDQNVDKELKTVGPREAVDIMSDLTGGEAIHEEVKGFHRHRLRIKDDVYTFVTVRRTWKNMVVYKNDEQGEFFAFDSGLGMKEFLGQAEGFVKKIVENGQKSEGFVKLENVDGTNADAEKDIGGEKSDKIPENGIKIWIDDIREAPAGFKWFKSVNEFIDWCHEHGTFDDVSLVDTDHDAGDYQSQGGDYIRCFDYLDFCGCRNVTIHIHSANPVGANNIRRIISRNKERGWKEIRNS